MDPGWYFVIAYICFFLATMLSIPASRRSTKGVFWNTFCLWGTYANMALGILYEKGLLGRFSDLELLAMILILLLPAYGTGLLARIVSARIS